MSRLGRIEKSVDGHHGAVLMSRWSHDGTALVTGTVVWIDAVTLLHVCFGLNGQLERMDM